MANEQNLVPFTSDQSHEEAVKNGQKGGINSGKARRARRTFRELMEEYGKMQSVSARGHPELDESQVKEIS